VFAVDPEELEVGRGIAEREFGFTVLQPETLAWPLQVELFKNAKVIVGEFGSGMHNAIFAGEGAHVGCIGLNNLTQTYIGALRRHQNLYLSTIPLENGEFEVDEAMFRTFLTVATGGAAA
jgi:O-antigen biosynthesis protein WbqL